MTLPALDLLDRIVESMSGTRRPNQEQMTAAVAEALDDGRVLLVQAGTGTGKSLGYLAAAVSAAHRGLHRDPGAAAPAARA
jgi:ATP-dependent DNA helicase DinG